MYKIITVGDCVVDTHVQIDNAALECDLQKKNCKLCFDYGSKIPITDSFQSLGGNASNVAAGLVKIGLETALLGSVGHDSNGEFVLENLKKYGVNTELVNLDTKNKTRYSVVLNYQGERTILSYTQKKVYSWPKLPTLDWIYYTSLSPGFESFQNKMMDYLKNNPQTKLALNPGSHMIKGDVKYLRQAIAKTQLLILNREEAEKILGIKRLKSQKKLIADLLDLGVKEVALTDAHLGAWYGNGKETWHCQSFPVKVVAKTGAGDAFSAGFLASKIYGGDVKQNLLWGIANSCNIITQMGTLDGLLEKSKIEKMIKKYNFIKPRQI